MSITSGFFNAEVVQGVYDREYSADDFAKCFNGFLTDGIIGKTKATSTSFKVESSGSTTKKVKVNPGYAWINGKWVESTSDVEFDINMPTAAGKMRFDLICLRCDYDQRNFSIVLKSGEETLEGEPSDIPQPQDDSHAKEIRLAMLEIHDWSVNMANVALGDARDMAEVKVNVSNMNGLIFVKCTQEEYDEMEVHDPSTMYFIVDEE